MAFLDTLREVQLSVMPKGVEHEDGNATLAGDAACNYQ